MDDLSEAGMDELSEAGMDELSEAGMDELSEADKRTVERAAILGMDDLSEADKLTGERARNAQRFFSQPFHVAGNFGLYVTLADTPTSFRKLYNGEMDHLPEEAFYMRAGNRSRRLPHPWPRHALRSLLGPSAGNDSLQKLSSLNNLWTRHIVQE
eukprot:199072_1